MRNEWVQYLIDFHTAGNVPVNYEPELPSEERRALRRKLLREEVREYFDAEDNNDLVHIADGLIDIIYIAIGTLLEYGIDPDAVMDEIQRSNMAKCVNGKLVHRPDGKILKPDNWTPPDVRGVIFAKRERGDGFGF